MFKWLTKSLQADEARSLASPQDWLIELFGALPTAAGISVTPSRALECSAAYACARLICDLVSDLPMHLFQRAEGGRERQRDHFADRSMNGFASPWLAGSELRREMTLQALQHGRAYARIVRVRRDPRELHILPSDAVTRTVDERTQEPLYSVTRADGGREELSFTDVLEVSALGGFAPVKLAREAIGLALLLEEHGARLFANGGRPSGLISLKGSVNPTTAAAVREAWQKAQAGDNRGKTAVLGGDADYRPLDFSSTDSEYLANRRFQVAEICRFFGINPILAGDLSAASFANSEEAGRQLLTFTLAPWLTAWQVAIARSLLTDDERRAGFYPEFQTAALTKADIQRRFAAFRQAIGGPWMTPAEGRAAENLPALDGADQLYPPQGTNPGGAPNGEN